MTPDKLPPSKLALMYQILLPQMQRLHYKYPKATGSIPSARRPVEYDVLS